MNIKICNQAILSGIFFLSGFSLYGYEVKLSGEGTYPLSPALTFYTDDSGLKTFDEILALHDSGKFVERDGAFSLSSASEWSRAVVLNPQEHTGVLYLVFPNPRILSGTVYTVSNATITRTEIGGGIARKDRHVKSRKQSVRLMFPPGKTEIFIRIEAPTITYIMEPVLYNELFFFSAVKKDESFYAAYFAVIFIMFLYNMFIFFNTRDRSYLFYVLYTLSILIGFTAMENYLVYFGFVDGFMSESYIITVALSLALFFANLFTMNFLNTKARMPAIHRLYMYLNVIILAAPSLRLVSFPLFFNLYYLQVICVVTLSMLAGFLQYRKYGYARIYTRAWTVYFISLFIFSVGQLLWDRQMPTQIFEIGSMIEVTMFSFALARRIRDIQEENKKLSLVKQEIKFAADFQKQLFPQTMPDSEIYEMSGLYIPSRTISGDFYDYSEDRNGNAIILISDVSGHGYSAGLIASMVKIAFHETAKTTSDGISQKSEMNRILLPILNNNYVTAGNLRIFEKEKKIEYTCCGHMPLIILDPDKNIRQFRPRGFPLGITKDFICEKSEIQYKGGERLILFTDGLVEATNHSEEMFGHARLHQTIAENSSLDCRTFSTQVINTFIDWKKSSSFEDDVTFVVIDLH